MDPKPKWPETKAARTMEHKLTAKDVETKNTITLKYDSQV